jgi:hypothetical protein
MYEYFEYFVNCANNQHNIASFYGNHTINLFQQFFPPTLQLYPDNFYLSCPAPSYPLSTALLDNINTIRIGMYCKW